MTDETQILIAGAGIAGLTAALALAQRGLDVTVADRFSEPSEIGAGLQIAPNASRILRALGVLDALEARAVAPSTIRLGDAPSGRILLDMPITPAWLERMGAPYLTAHRAVLHDALYQAALAHPAIRLLTGHAVSTVRENDGHVITTLETNEGETAITSRILIGADGIWSKVRAHVSGASQPKPTGRIAWRAIGPSQGAGSSVTAWMMPDSHLVTYPVRNEDTYNAVAITRGQSTQGDWAQAADPAALRRLLDSVRPIDGFARLENANWTTWPLNAVDPAGVWHSARILLIGDAAHGMEPFAAQGAAMAIEDGYAAGVAIAGSGDEPAKAFAGYDSLRRGRVKRVAKRTAFNRWVYHQDGIGRLARNNYFKLRSPGSFVASLDWLYGYRFDG